MGTELSDRFFGGTNNVRIKLVDALREARERKGLTPEDVDVLYFCGFGIVPCCKLYEANPQRITPFIFSLVSSVLGVCLDTALPVDLSKPEDMSYVVEHMKKAGAYLVGVNERDKITRKDAVPVYLLFKIMEELEQGKRSRVA